MNSVNTKYYYSTNATLYGMVGDRKCDNDIVQSIKKETTVQAFEAECEKNGSYKLISPGPNGDTALHAAVKCGNIELVRHLGSVNKKAADPNTLESSLKPWERLRWECWKNPNSISNGVYNLFLIHNNSGLCPLHVAAELGDIEMANELLFQGSPVNIAFAPCILETTPFCFVKAKGNWEMASFLGSLGGK